MINQQKRNRGRPAGGKAEKQSRRWSQWRTLVTVLAGALGKGYSPFIPLKQCVLGCFPFPSKGNGLERGSWEAPAHVSGGLSSQGSQPVPLFCHPQYLGLTPTWAPTILSNAQPRLQCPQLMLQRKSPNWSPGYSWIKLITKQDIHGNSQAVPLNSQEVPLKAQARSRSSQQLWLSPDSSLNSCWEYEDILSNMSAKTTLVMPISTLFMMVKPLGSKPNVNTGGFIK